MKIISWNIGNFIYAKCFPGRKHYCFHVPDMRKVSQMIKKENADIVFLQEIMNEDIDFVIQNFTEFRYNMKIRSDDRLSKSIFLSKYEIQEIHHTNSNDYIINDITFFPIHLNAFSPKKRYEQAKLLVKDLPSKKGVILGDTNFWIFKSNFISDRDKKSYNKILENHIDILKKLGHTCRIFLSLDKIFITKDLKHFDEKIVRHKISQIDHFMIVSNIENENKN